MSRRILILGAAGRDFHDFNVVYRNDPTQHVVGFTATQIPGIAGRKYPPALAGPSYPEGIPIYLEGDLERLIQSLHVDEVVLAYSDLSHEAVMHLASRTLAAGADFKLHGPRSTALSSRVPVVAVCAVRTGCGKSPLTRALAGALGERGRRVAVVRHPMPYGDLERQRAQRFASLDDIDAADCTIEEREEYEPLVRSGHVVFAGVDYGEILSAAEEDAEVIIWDGGNNDLPFFRPNVHVTVLDPHREGHETRYHPGEANLRSADLLVISKVGTAEREALDRLRATLARLRPGIPVVEGDLEITFDRPAALEGRRVLCVEDGPTITHGGMGYGAAVLAARQAGAVPVDPRPFAAGSLADTFAAHPHVRDCLPAMGYSEDQIFDLGRTIAGTPCDFVLIGTPIDLRHLIPIAQPTVRVQYRWRDLQEPGVVERVVAMSGG